MSYNKPIKRIAIVGTGVIGASWAAEYLARGFDVVATDPGPNAEANLRKYVDEAWNDLTKIGLSKGASKDRLTFTKDSKEALSKAETDYKEFSDHAHFTLLQEPKVADYVLGWALYRSNGSKLTAVPNNTDTWSVQLSA